LNANYAIEGGTMPNIIEGEMQAKGMKFGVVVSRFNDFITAKLVEGSLDVLIRHGAKDQDIDIIKVPGAFEIPFAARMLVDRKSYDAVICLGAVIRGATPHFDYVSAEATKGIAGNKGAEVTLGAIEMVNLYRQLGK
jgi:6,7-dimethyl-8-ribityllumazine synthase